MWKESRTYILFGKLGLVAFNFIWSSYIWAQSCVWRTIHTGHERTN